MPLSLDGNIMKIPVLDSTFVSFLVLNNFLQFYTVHQGVVLHTTTSQYSPKLMFRTLKEVLMSFGPDFRQTKPKSKKQYYCSYLRVKQMH